MSNCISRNCNYFVNYLCCDQETLCFEINYYTIVHHCIWRLRQLCDEFSKVTWTELVHVPKSLPPDKSPGHTVPELSRKSPPHPSQLLGKTRSQGLLNIFKFKPWNPIWGNNDSPCVKIIQASLLRTLCVTESLILKFQRERMQTYNWKRAFHGETLPSPLLFY